MFIQDHLNNGGDKIENCPLCTFVINEAFLPHTERTTFLGDK